MKTEVETGEMCLQALECQGIPGAIKEKAWKESPPESSGGELFCGHLGF